MFRYFIIYKPYQVLSQFSQTKNEAVKKTLKDYFNVPVDVYPVGRLDYDSEGLLLLTNDSQLNHRLLNPAFSHEREYWVQVEGNPTQQALDNLRDGVKITVDGKSVRLKKCKVELMQTEPAVPPRFPSIRFRQNIPVSWMKLIITEGKNRQVRKMTASVGHPTLRLIRYRIGNANINGLVPGRMKELNQSEIKALLF